MVQACLRAAQREADIHHDVVHNKGTIEPEKTRRIVSPLAKKLEAGVCQHFPRCILARWRRSVHLNRLALRFDFPTQASGVSKAKHDIANVLITNA